MRWARLPLRGQPRAEGFSHHTGGQCLLNEGVWCAQHTLSNAQLARVLSEACPTCFHSSWYFTQPVIIWVAEAVIHYSPGVLVLSSQLSLCSLSTLATADNGVPGRLRPPANNGGRNACGTQSVPWSWPWMLERTPAGDGDSQARGKTPGSAIPQHCPHIKEMRCPLNNRASKAQGSSRRGGACHPQTSSAHPLH